MPPHRAGFAALVGPPNVGKSTLLNRLVAEKMAIVSPRPQTTRTRITGIRNLPDVQIVFVDTPGLARGGGRLGELMWRAAERAAEDVDLVCLVVDATGRPDQLGGDVVADLLGQFEGRSTPVYCCLNKIDLVEPKARLLPLIAAYRERYPFREIVPVSAALGTNCDRLLDMIAAAMPERPPLFPPESLTDQPETFFAAEMIREKIFRLTHQEVPYACAVRVEELVERGAPPCLYLQAVIFVEQASQKGILIGRGGSMLKRIGTAARLDLERFFGIKVFLELRVEVRRAWRRNEAALREFGFLRTS
jgi:GTP-binding protein Era